MLAQMMGLLVRGSRERSFPDEPWSRMRAKLGILPWSSSGPNTSHSPASTPIKSTLGEVFWAARAQFQAEVPSRMAAVSEATKRVRAVLVTEAPGRRPLSGAVDWKGSIIRTLAFHGGGPLLTPSYPRPVPPIPFQPHAKDAHPMR